MVVLIVGGDRLGKITEKLRQEGADDIIHWDGREHSYRTKLIPKKVMTVIIFCDFINHLVMHNIKRQTKQNGIPVIYSKRAISPHDSGFLCS